MFISDEKLQSILIDAGMIDKASWEDAYNNALRLQVPVEDVLKERDIIAGHVLYEIVANALNIRYINLKTHDIEPEVLDLFSYRISSTYRAVPFKVDPKKKEIHVAMVDPSDQKALHALARATKKTIVPYLAGVDGFRLISRYYQKHVAKDLKAQLKKLVGKKTSLTKATLEKVYALMMEYVFYAQPSDIHIEHIPGGGVVKLRVDGFLRDELFVHDEIATTIINDIKRKAHMVTDEGHKTADGRFSERLFGEDFSFRVSLLPTYYGEKACLRVINESAQKLSLRDLGFLDADIEIIKKESKRPFGLILVAGPTGSGKSSTLYTILKSLNVEGVSIATIEDPIEYSIRHINQSQVDVEHGFTFAAGLRTLLRQDPNIIMVGEIRDGETAETTIQSALTGHIVLSTIHANTAAGTVTRLRNMGVKPYLLGPTMNLAIAQRLLKKICTYCRESYRVDEKTLTALNKDTGLFKALDHLKTKKLVSFSRYRDIFFFQGKGCAHCAQKGLKGRTGAFEILNIDDTIRTLIAQDVPEHEIELAARRKGMLTLFEDSLLKALDGLTTLEEALKAANR